MIASTCNALLKTSLLTTSALIIALSSPTIAWAQTGAAPEEQAGTEDIVVEGRFLDQGTKSAMKMDIGVLDTPFTVASYSQAFVKTIETTSLNDLYNYMTGVKKAGNTGYDITLRGFKSTGDDRNAIMVDGLPGLTGRYGSPPTIGIERVEVVKGPMSVLYGAIQPGGFINMIAKKPSAKASTEMQVRGFTYAGSGISMFERNGIDLAFDSTGTLGGANSPVTYRLVGEYLDRKGFRDFTYDRGPYIAPSLTWEIGPSTTLTVMGEYRKSTSSFDNGLAVRVPNDITTIASITTRYQEPENYRTEKGKSGTLLFSHDFNNGLKLNVGFRHVDYDSKQQEFSSRAPVLNAALGWRVPRRARDLTTARTYDYLDINLPAQFNTGGIGHKMLVGFNIGKDKISQDRQKYFQSDTRNSAGVCPVGRTCLDIDFFDPVYGLSPSFDSLPTINPARPSDSALLTNELFKTHAHGIYISDLITLSDKFKVLLSARNFRETSTSEELRVPGVPSERKVSEKTLLPSAGILFQPSNHITFYGSYAESFNPVDPSAQDITGSNPFHPISGKQYELGMKAENLANGKLNVTLSVFQITQSGVLFTQVCDLFAGVSPGVAGNCSEQIGENRSRGLELETNMTPVDGLQIVAGYAYIDAKVISDKEPTRIGAQLQNTAKHSANFWTNYSFKNGIGLGLGVTYTGKRQGVLTNRASDQLELPAYLLVDATLTYAIGEHFSINLKAGNIFNKEYIESTSYLQPTVLLAPGAPRNFTLSARYRF